MPQPETESTEIDGHGNPTSASHSVTYRPDNQQRCLSTDQTQLFIIYIILIQYYIVYILSMFFNALFLVPSLEEF